MDLSKYIVDFKQQLSDSQKSLQELQQKINEEQQLMLKLLGAVEALAAIQKEFDESLEVLTEPTVVTK